MKLKCKRVSIMDLCNVERAVPGKTYKAGSCYIKLSAVDEFVGQIVEEGGIDSRFAVFEPKEKINTSYLYIAIQRCFSEFLRRYRTTINLQFDCLKHFTLDWHNDKKAQEYVVAAIKAVDKEIALVNKQLTKEKELKRWYLAKMIP